MNPTELVQDALAVSRLVRLVTEDRLTEAPRAAVSARGGLLGYMVTCPHCVSVWAAVAAVTARRVAPGVWEPLSRVLAFSAVAGLIAERA